MNGTLEMFYDLRQSIGTIGDTQVRVRALKKVAALEKAPNKQTAIERIGALVRLTDGSAVLDKAVIAFLPGISKWIRHLSKN